jgi:hypothetical protein
MPVGYELQRLAGLHRWKENHEDHQQRGGSGMQTPNQTIPKTSETARCSVGSSTSECPVSTAALIDLCVIESLPFYPARAARRFPENVHDHESRFTAVKVDSRL